MKSVLTAIIFLLFCTASFAKTYVLTDDNPDGISLYKYLEYYEDKDKTITVNDFIDIVDLSPIKNSLGSSSNYWFRITVFNQSNTPAVFFVIKAPFLDYIDFYYHDSNTNLVAYHTGDRLPFASRPLNYDYNFTFPVTLKNGKNDFYIKVQSTSPIRLPLSVYSQQNYIKNQLNSMLVIGVIVGILALLSIFFLMLTLYARFKIFLFLLFIVLCDIYYMLQTHGLTFKYIFKDYPLMDDYSVLFNYLLAATSALVVVDCFPVEKKHPLKKSFKIFIRISLCLFIACLPALFLLSFSNSKVIVYNICNLSYFIGVSFLILIFGFKRPYTLTMIGYCLATFAIGSDEIISRMVIYSNTDFYLINFIPQCINILAMTFWGMGVVHATSVYLNDRNISVKDLKKALKKSEEIEEKFVTVLCHELGTPVQSAEYSLNKLHKLVTNEEMKKVVDRLGLSIQKLSYLINNFIQKSQSNNYQMVYKYEMTDLKYLIKKVITVLAPFVSEQKHAIFFEVDSQSDNFLVNIDKNLIEQALINVILNAIKYTPSNGVIIVRLKNEPNKILIQVIDNGYGIKSTHSDNIFIAFYRSDFIKNTAGGLGIGLSISQNIIHDHKGTISYISPLPEEYDYLKNPAAHRLGTIFNIYLPAAQNEKRINPTTILDYFLY